MNQKMKLNDDRKGGSKGEEGGLQDCRVLHKLVACATNHESLTMYKCVRVGKNALFLQL